MLFVRTRWIALLVAAAVMAISSLASCVGTPPAKVIPPVPTTEKTSPPATSPEVSSSAPEITIRETIGVTDFPQTLSAAVIRVAEAIGVADSPILTPIQTQPPPTTTQKIIVSVASPKAGEIWRVSTAQSVAWTATGESIAYVDIYYSTDAGKSMISVARKELNDGIYTWKVPNTPSKTVLVRVLVFNVNGETLALGDSGLFTISVQ